MQILLGAAVRALTVATRVAPLPVQGSGHGNRGPSAIGDGNHAALGRRDYSVATNTSWVQPESPGTRSLCVELNARRVLSGDQSMPPIWPAE